MEKLFNPRILVFLYKDTVDVIPVVALDIFYGKKKAIRERRFIILLNFT